MEGIFYRDAAILEENIKVESVLKQSREKFIRRILMLNSNTLSNKKDAYRK